MSEEGSMYWGIIHHIELNIGRTLTNRGTWALGTTLLLNLSSTTRPLQCCNGLVVELTFNKSGLIDLAINFDDVDLATGAVGKWGNLHGSLVPAHHSGTRVERFNENDGLVGGHGKAVGKCLVIKQFASLLENGRPSCCRVINQVIGAQRLGHIGKDHGSSACWGAAVAAGATFCNATNCAWSVVAMALSLAEVGVGAAMFTWRQVMATMGAVGESCWVLF